MLEESNFFLEEIQIRPHASMQEPRGMPDPNSDETELAIDSEKLEECDGSEEG